MNRVEEIADYKQGRSCIRLTDGTSWILYKGEIRSYRLKIGVEISDELYDEIQTEVIGKRARKRAMYLLERRDYTEAGLREKLSRNEYPPEAIEGAIAYVKYYHYLDDERYARNYIRCYQDTRSRRRIQQELLVKGVNKVFIETAMEEEYEGEELQMIYHLLEKKGYNGSGADEKEKRRIYAFLLRRGFRSEDILKAMKSVSDTVISVDTT